MERGLGGTGNHFLASSAVVLPLLEGSKAPMGAGTDLHSWDCVQWEQMT